MEFSVEQRLRDHLHTSIVCGGYDGRVYVLARMNEPRAWSIAAHNGPVRAVCLSAGATTIVSAGDDGRVCFWNSSTGTLVAALHAHSAPITSLAIHPPTGYVVSADAKGVLAVHSLQKEATIAAIHAHAGRVSSVELTVWPWGSAPNSVAVSGTPVVSAPAGGVGKAGGVMGVTGAHVGGSLTVATGGIDGLIKLSDLGDIIACGITVPPPIPSATTAQPSSLTALPSAPTGSSPAVASPPNMTNAAISAAYPAALALPSGGPTVYAVYEGVSAVTAVATDFRVTAARAMVWGATVDGALRGYCARSGRCLMSTQAHADAIVSLIVTATGDVVSCGGGGVAVFAPPATADAPPPSQPDARLTAKVAPACMSICGDTSWGVAPSGDGAHADGSGGGGGDGRATAAIAIGFMDCSVCVIDYDALALRVRRARRDTAEVAAIAAAQKGSTAPLLALSFASGRPPPKRDRRGKVAKDAEDLPALNPRSAETFNLTQAAATVIKGVLQQYAGQDGALSVREMGALCEAHQVGVGDPTLAETLYRKLRKPQGYSVTQDAIVAAIAALFGTAAQRVSTLWRLYSLYDPSFSGEVTSKSLPPDGEIGVSVSTAPALPIPATKGVLYNAIAGVGGSAGFGPGSVRETLGVYLNTQQQHLLEMLLEKVDDQKGGGAAAPRGGANGKKAAPAPTRPSGPGAKAAPAEAPTLSFERFCEALHQDPHLLVSFLPRLLAMLGGTGTTVTGTL